MVPSHLRWLELEAPEVLPAATRAHRLLLWAWLPAMAMVSIAMVIVARSWSGGDPTVLAGTAFLVIWLVVFLPPAALGLPVAWKASRAGRSGARSQASRGRLRMLALLHFLLVAFAAIALVPSARLMLTAMRHHLGGA